MDQNEIMAKRMAIQKMMGSAKRRMNQENPEFMPISAEPTRYQYAGEKPSEEESSSIKSQQSMSPEMYDKMMRQKENSSPMSDIEKQQSMNPDEYNEDQDEKEVESNPTEAKTAALKKLMDIKINSDGSEHPEGSTDQEINGLEFKDQDLYPDEKEALKEKIRQMINANHETY